VTRPHVKASYVPTRDVTTHGCKVDMEQANGRALASKTKSSPGALVLLSHPEMGVMDADDCMFTAAM